MTPRLLVVDDEPHMVRLASYVLETAGYDVITARDGGQALAILGTEQVDLALCDIMMPGLDGLALLRTIRSTARTASLPVVMLTARGEEVDREKAAGLGANGYLTKPFSSSELLSEVQRQVGPPVSG